LIDKEFAALTFFVVAIQQFQGLAEQERITLKNIDNEELVPKGDAYVEEIASTYESRSYISLFSALVSSIVYIVFARKYGLSFFYCTILAIVSGAIVGLIFRRFLRRNSIADIADIVPAKISFEGPILMVNGVIITNIGLESTREKYRNECLAIEVIPRDLGAFGIVNDIGQRQAIIHNLFIHMGIDRDVDEVDIVAISKTNLEKSTVVIPYMPILKDIDVMIDVVKSTPIIETSKGKQSDFSRKTL
uniref:YIEGIA domain-containing protein n=1 Tax=Clostridioides difficile TaxID=1496 RepID=UPI002FCDCA0A